MHIHSDLIRDFAETLIELMRTVLVLLSFVTT